MSKYVTEQAKLSQIALRTDAQAVARWSSAIAEKYAAQLNAPLYQTTLMGADLNEKTVIIGGAGRLIGMRIQVSHSILLGEIDVNGRVFESYEEKPEEGFENIPFSKIFALCNKLREKLQTYIAPQFYRVPFVGGIQSIYLSDDMQVIADYYLPEIEIFGDGEHFEFFTTRNCLEEVDLPAEAVKEEYSRCSLKKKKDFPDRAGYHERMDHVLDILKKDECQKIVVSRMCELIPGEEFDLFQFTAYELDTYFQEYFYLFRQGEEDYWTGISPEIIMKQIGRRAVTKPLAGTRKKTGNDPKENEAIRHDLVTTKKDIVEHEHALYFMENQLKTANIGEVKIEKNKIVLETPYTFHLQSILSVALLEGKTCFDMIGALYPPATIWGIPVDRTEDVLRVTEPFDREYFTGVYGYWNYCDEADAALIIRSAKIGKNAVKAYAGGGIVKYSDIDAEFDETINKMRPLVSYFTAE